jgi:hypothetical protein
MRTFFAFLATFIFLHASITDDAYKAYKNQEYKKAFHLYQKAYSQGSTKAAYNLAVFYEKGIGVKKDTKKAIYYYSYVRNKIQSDIYSSKICRSSMLNYYKKTLKKLYSYNHQKEYKRDLNALIKSCKNGKNRGSFCTKDNKIVYKYKDLLACIDCNIVKKYPKTTKKYLSLAIKREKDIDNITLNNKIIRVVKPFINIFKKRAISCAKSAKTKGDLQACYNSYIYCSSPYTTGSYIIAESCGFGGNSKVCKKEVTSQERAKLIKSLK